MKANTYLTTSACTNLFLSSLERRRWPENIIAILNLISVRETSRFNFRCKVFHIRDQGPWTGTTPRCLSLNESCWPKILYRKDYGDKKGVNHSNNKERYSAGNLDDLLWKYCKSRYADLSCLDVHWNFWRMCNSLRLGSEVCNWYRLAISPIWRRRSTNV